MSCRISIQIKRAGEETSIKDYYKYANFNTEEIKYKDLYTFWCDQVITTHNAIFIKKDDKKFKAINLMGQPPQPYIKGVVYNEVELTDEFVKELGIDSKLTSWIYIECNHI